MAGDLGANEERVPGRVQVVPEESFAKAAAGLLGKLLRRLTAKREVAVALAGGSTPRPVYEQLAGTAAIRWERVRVYFGDERAVPPDDPRSNFAMARDALLERVGVPPERVHRMEAERKDLEAAARAYAERLPRRLDLLLLGVGADGHIASLFPGSPALREEKLRVVAVTAPAPPRRRLTVTPPVIREASRVVVLAAGVAKAGAVGAALRGPSEEVAACPARLVRRRWWILDQAAASGLEKVAS